MGAPKQKWTPEEEAALKSGILKHGAGKWRTILKDPQFCHVLYQRSNVDLKDKWRNMTVMANGLGSRERARLSSSGMHTAARLGESSVSLSSPSQSDDEPADAGPTAVSGGSSPNNSPKGSIMRLDNLIMEAINNSREPGGSSKTTIAAYVEDQYCAPPNFRRVLSGKLKHLSAMGKLIKLKRKYRVALPSTIQGRRKSSSISILESRRRISAEWIPDDFDFHLEREAFNYEIPDVSGMTPEEVTAYAALLVAEAEKAMAAAEEALREAEAAEAEADAAEAFAEATLRTAGGIYAPKTGQTSKD